MTLLWTEFLRKSWGSTIPGHRKPILLCYYKHIILHCRKELSERISCFYFSKRTVLISETICTSKQLVSPNRFLYPVFTNKLKKYHFCHFKGITHFFSFSLSPPPYPYLHQKKCNEISQNHCFLNCDCFVCVMELNRLTNAEGIPNPSHFEL